MKKIIACLISLILFSGPVFAQSFFEALKSKIFSRDSEERVAPMPMSMPRIIVSPDRKPISLQDLKVDIEVIGNIAMTTYEMTFHNPNQVVMEGEFVLPLAGNQNVSAVALDINGKMREGVVVEKQKARETFESIVRLGVDPLLVEKTSGNQFKTRIYPFNPDNTRRIRVTVEEPLVTKDGEYYYNLPLDFKQNVNFSINLELPLKAKEIKQDFNKNVPFKFEKTQTVLKASFAKKDWLLENNVIFSIPKNGESEIFTHKDGKDIFFYTDINVRASSKDKIMPKKIALVWDSSLSSSKRDIGRELSLLDSYFKKISDVEIVFVSFNIKEDINKNFSVKNGNWAALKKEIEELIYDGATRFDGLKLNNLKADEVLLFSDGISTFGNTVIAQADIPLIAVNSSAEFNRGGLTGVSMKSGGNFINLNSLSDKEALEFLTGESLKLISYTFDKNKFKDVYPEPGANVGENFSFAGILTDSEGEITLSFGYNKKEIIQTKTIKIKAGGDNSAVARLWAVQKIKELETDSEKNEQEILKLGQEYSVVTEFTSLLVLEDVYDYVTYKITPPQELLAEYNQIMKNKARDENQKEEISMSSALAQAKEIKEWYKKDFNQDKAFHEYKKRRAARSASAPQSAAFEYGNVERGLATGGIESMATEAAASEEAEDSSTATVQLKAWDPQTPYMKILKKSKNEELYRDYLKLKDGYEDQPSFYFDVTDEFIKRGMKDRAVVILSNVAEMKLDNAELLRTVANKLMELGEYKYAIDMFEKIVKLRGEDPQSYRDLALAYQANKEYQKALDTFYKILTGAWGRFDIVKQIVFVEMNNLISLSPKLNLSKINKELIFAMPVDIRIVLGWSTDNTDIDIHVRDPYNEEAFYGNRLTGIGAKVSQDLTQGFGPEEFMIKKAINGKYEIFTNNFGDSRQSVSGPTVLYLDIFTFYGTKKQTHNRVLVRTENVKDRNIIGTVDFENK